MDLFKKLNDFILTITSRNENFWEQRKLGKVIERRTQKREFSDLPYIEYADIIPNIGRLNKDIFSRKNTKQGIYFQKNDILFGKLRPYLNNWLKPQFEGIAVGDFWILNGIKLNNDFLYYYIQTKKFSDVANVTTGTKMPRSDWNLVSNLKIKFPNFEEQQNIGKLFYSLENLITLYDRELKLLSQIKKYFLDNLFAKKEYPNLRFKGFTDAWEQRKLSSILIERKDLSTESKQFPLSSFIQEKGVVPKSQRYDRSFLVKDSSKKYKVTKFGDFIYSSNNLDTGSIGLNSYGNAVISPVYSVFSSKNSNILETNFVNLLFQQNFYKNKMLRFRQGVMYGQLKIKEDDFLKVKVNVPSQIEIKNIINLFSKIESYATLLENKKKQLVQIKNTLLNTMFI